MRASPIRRGAAVLLAALLALPVGDLAAAVSDGVIQGSVSLEGRPLSGVTVAFIELESGEVVRAVSGVDGSFETSAAPGRYAVTTESRTGLTVGQAPVRVAVASGEVASARVELLSVPSGLPPAAIAAGTPQEPSGATLPAGAPQGPAAPVFAETTGSGADIRFQPVTCFIAGEFPLLDASITPMASVARARVYFKSAVGDEFYYIEMSQDQGAFFGKLPRPSVEASPITYYLQSTTTEFEESQTREVEAIVVEDESECEDRLIAAFGPPGAITVFSATSGASVVTPLGFAAAGGIAIGTILIIAGAAAAGIVGGVVTDPGGPGGPTPPPVVVEPSPIPTPVPIPTPSPTAITTFR